MKHLKQYNEFVNEMHEMLEAAYIPPTVKEFAKRKGVMHIVKMVAGWAENAGKRINGGTAIGKNYDTLILDLRHQGSEIRINLGSDDITLHGHKVTDAKSFKNALALSESTIIEGQSTIGITTHDDAVIDGIDDLTADLDKARIKYKYNRLTRTLSVFNMDKRFFKKAKKIIDDSGFGILLAKESVNEAYTDEERKALADKGFALSDGSFPIKNLDDLKNAIQAYGRAKDQARAAKFIVKRAKALGAEDLIPDTEDFQKSLSESF
jgi:hypothetical protein